MVILCAIAQRNWYGLYKKKCIILGSIVFSIYASSMPMDIVDTIPQDTITQLSKQGVADLRADLRNNNPVREMNIGCELAYNAYTNALDMIKRPISSADRKYYADILTTYLNKCVEPHIDVYKDELHKVDNTQEETRIFIKRIERLTRIQDSIKIALSTAQ